MKKLLSGIAALVVSISVAYAQAPTKLLVYASLEPDQLSTIKSAFEAENPSVIIDWVRAPIGTITARVLAEKSNPRADVVYGLGASNLIQLDKEGLLMKYVPPEAANLGAKFRSKTNTWFAYDAFLAALCYNTIEGDKLGLRKPTSIKDLLKPEFKGRIQMPEPTISGTGFMIVASILDLYGEQKGWEYLDALDNNIVKYLPSGSTPCTQAANGEYLMGWSVDIRAGRLIADGAPIEFIVPSEGVFWDLEGAAIMAGTKNVEAAKTLYNWIYSKNAMKIYGKDYAILGRADVDSNSKHHPHGKNIAKFMVDSNLESIANNRVAILKEWEKRYGARTKK